MLNQIWITTISYAVIFIGTFLLLNFLTRGFLFKWLKTLLGRGKYILLQVRNPIQDYWLTATLFGDTVTLIDREAKHSKSKKTLTIKDNVIFKVFGVSCAYFDEATNTLISIKGEQVSAYDPIKITSFIERALMKPDNPEDQKRWKLQLLIYAGLGIGLAIIYFKLSEMEKVINILKPVAKETGGVISGLFWLKIRRK